MLQEAIEQYKTIREMEEGFRKKHEESLKKLSDMLEKLSQDELMKYTDACDKIDGGEDVKIWEFYGGKK